MMEYVKEVLVPYATRVKEELGLPPTAKPLLIFDVFKAHRDEDLLQLIKDSGFVYYFISASCTGELQPLDLTVNAKFKSLMKAQFISWYAGEVGRDPEKTVDLKLSTIKPLHARWMIDVLSELKGQKELVISGFSKAGI